MTHLLPRGALLAAALLAPLTAAAQAITDPNEIVGEVRLLVSNPAILDVLRPPPGLDQGLSSVAVTASSTIPPSLEHRTGGTALPSGLGVAYDLTVESSAAGIPYALQAHARFDGGRDEYSVTGFAAPPVMPDPAPDAEASVSECLSMLDVRYLLDDGSPLPWDGGRLDARRETVPASASYAAQAWNHALGGGDHSEYLAVRGGARFRVETRAFLVFGSDPETDLVRIELPCDREVDVPCDELVPVTCVFTAGDCQAPGDPPGRIAGILDVLGHEEAPRDERSIVTAHDGPLDNRRTRVLRSDPSSGPYELVNLLPSETPGWAVRAAVVLRTSRGEQGITLPGLGAGSNPRVPVRSGEVTDLGETFVVDPGTVRGSVVLSGPPPRGGGSLLSDVLAMGVPAHGLDVLAPGATRTAAGGSTGGAVDGGMDASERNWRGDYDFVLGGLNREPSVWDVRSLGVASEDRLTPEVPETFHVQSLRIDDRTRGPLQVVPGGAEVIDWRHCVSEVHLGVHSTSGTFTNPVVSAGGRLAGTDFLGRAADLDYSLRAEGTPAGSAAASDRGLVVMTMPEGEWTLGARVASVSPRGSRSDTQLPPIAFPVGCRQVIKLVSQLIPRMSTLPECVTDAASVVDGSFLSEDDVVRLQWTLNGAAPVDLCSPCGNSPSFSFPVSWEACENELLIEAEDSQGRIASVTGWVMRDGTGPAVGADRMVLWPPNHASWCYRDASRFVRIADDCPGEPEWSLTSCRSSQPDDAEGAEDSWNAGDGSTTGDCLRTADGRGFCVRAERLGGCREGRRYAIGIRAVDGCGNVTESQIIVEAPHEWSPSLQRFVVTPDARFRDGEPPVPTLPPLDPDAHLPVPFACR